MVKELCKDVNVALLLWNEEDGVWEDVATISRDAAQRVVVGKDLCVREHGGGGGSCIIKTLLESAVTLDDGICMTVCVCVCV